MTNLIEYVHNLFHDNHKRIIILHKWRYNTNDSSNMYVSIYVFFEHLINDIFVFDDSSSTLLTEYTSSTHSCGQSFHCLRSRCRRDRNTRREVTTVPNQNQSPANNSRTRTDPTRNPTQRLACSHCVVRDRDRIHTHTTFVQRSTSNVYAQYVAYIPPESRVKSKARTTSASFISSHLRHACASSCVCNSYVYCVRVCVLLCSIAISQFCRCRW